MCKILDKVACKGLLERVTFDQRLKEVGFECALWIYYDIWEKNIPRRGRISTKALIWSMPDMLMEVKSGMNEVGKGYKKLERGKEKTRACEVW